MQPSNTHFLAHPEVKEPLDPFSPNSSANQIVGLCWSASRMWTITSLRCSRRSPLRQSAKSDFTSFLNTRATCLRIGQGRSGAAGAPTPSTRWYDGTSELRKLRNEVAHCPGAFRLDDQDQRLRQMFKLGDQIPVFINKFVVELMVRDFTTRVLGADGLKDDEGQPYFRPPWICMSTSYSNPSLIEPLEERRRRYELAMGVGLICALIIRHREEAEALFGPNETLSDVARRVRPDNKAPSASVIGESGPSSEP